LVYTAGIPLQWQTMVEGNKKIEICLQDISDVFDSLRVRTSSYDKLYLFYPVTQTNFDCPINETSVLLQRIRDRHLAPVHFACLIPLTQSVPAVLFTAIRVSRALYGHALTAHLAFLQTFCSPLASRPNRK